MEKMIQDLKALLENLKKDADADKTKVANIETQIKTLETKLTEMTGKQAEEIAKGIKKEIEKLTQPVIIQLQTNMEEMRKDLDSLRRRALANAGLITQRRPGHVSEPCAKYLGAVAVMAAERQGKFANLGQHQVDILKGMAKEILAEQKTALSTTDIPLPEQYAAELSELVDSYGTARRYGTVFPMGAGTVKLPRLKTDPAFGLLAIATAIDEKSPQIEFVTLTASKWGGLVRVPSEIDQDSIVAIGQFIARYCARQMALIEDTVFWAADGTATYDSLSGLTKIVVTNAKLLDMGTGKTRVQDVTLTNLRELRTKVDNAALFNSAYYLHASLEQKLHGFNTESKVQVYVPNGVMGATLDGFPVRWINVLPTYANTTASTVFGLFGDVTYEYLGMRLGMSMDTSREAAFATDEILVRAIERFTIGNMATGAVAGIRTAAN